MGAVVLDQLLLVAPLLLSHMAYNSCPSLKSCPPRCHQYHKVSPALLFRMNRFAAMLAAMMQYVSQMSVSHGKRSCLYNFTEPKSCLLAPSRSQDTNIY